jgi:hypothetical protein
VSIDELSELHLLKTHPLYPPLKQIHKRDTIILMFERGSICEEGLAPLFAGYAPYLNIA